MAGRKRSAGTNKSEFIRNVLEKNPEASAKDVQTAWTEAGETEELNPTLYYQIRQKLGLSRGRGRRRGGRKRKAEAGATPVAARAVTANGSSNDDYLALESQIDKLVAQAEAIGDSKLASDLRQARRRVSAKLL